MPVAQTTATAFQQYDFLTIFRDVAEIFASVCVVNNSAARNVDVFVNAVLAGRFVLCAVATVASEDVTLVLQVDECPELLVATQDDMTATATIATVGTTLRNIFGTMEVRTSCAAFATATRNLYIVNEIGFSHRLLMSLCV